MSSSARPRQKFETMGSMRSAKRRASALSAARHSTAACACAASAARSMPMARPPVTTSLPPISTLSDGAAALGEHDLVGGVVERHEIDVVEVEQHEVGLVALGDLADEVPHAQHPR